MYQSFAEDEPLKRRLPRPSPEPRVPERVYGAYSQEALKGWERTLFSFWQKGYNIYNMLWYIRYYILYMTWYEIYNIYIIWRGIRRCSFPLSARRGQRGQGALRTSQRASAHWFSAMAQPSYPNYPEMVNCAVCGAKGAAKRRRGYGMTCADCTECQALEFQTKHFAAKKTWKRHVFTSFHLFSLVFTCFDLFWFDFKIVLKDDERAERCREGALLRKVQRALVRGPQLPGLPEEIRALQGENEDFLESSCLLESFRHVFHVFGGPGMVRPQAAWAARVPFCVWWGPIRSRTLRRTWSRA